MLLYQFLKACPWFPSKKAPEHVPPTPIWFSWVGLREGHPLPSPRFVAEIPLGPSSGMILDLAGNPEGDGRRVEELSNLENLSPFEARGTWQQVPT